MPRKPAGAYLYWYEKEKTWLIRDGRKTKRTGCGEGEAGRVEAERKLSEYLNAKWQPDTTEHRPSAVLWKDVIMVYVEAKLPEKRTRHRYNELLAQAERLIDYCGADPLTVVNGAWCRAFVKRSSTVSMARHDLEIARAAVHHYEREYGLDFVPKFTFPEKGLPRTGHLSRDMAAKLIHKARRAGNAHLARYILIGLYTGTRSSAILAMQWLPNTEGGWFDLDKRLMHRRPEGERETRKRKPSIPIPNRLLAHLKRWKRLDSGNFKKITKNDDSGKLYKGTSVIRHVIHWRGERVRNIKRAWNTARIDAGLPKWVIPHILRHTSITWAMAAGKNVNTVSQFFGVSLKVLESVYWQHHPRYQEEMRRS